MHAHSSLTDCKMPQTCLLVFACAFYEQAWLLDAHEIKPGFTTKIWQHMCFWPSMAIWAACSHSLGWVYAAQPCSAPQTPMQLQCCGPQTNFMRLSLWLVSCCHRCPMPLQLFWPTFPPHHKFLTVSCQRSHTYSSSSFYIPTSVLKTVFLIHRP